MPEGIVQERVKASITEAFDHVKEKGLLDVDSFPIPSLEFPKHEEWGDLSTTAAMSIAKRAKRPPKEIADLLAQEIRDSCDYIEQVNVAPPGFLNFKLRSDCWLAVLRDIQELGTTYGHTPMGDGQRVLVEYVSANPTGPLHMGHGRGAALGDALSRLLQAAGYVVEREYYINDAGRQMKLLASSVYARYRQLHGQDSTFPEDGYQGEYIKNLAASISEKIGTAVLEQDHEEAEAECGRLAYEILLHAIQEDLKAFGVEFETWFSEASLFSSQKIEQALDDLKSRDLVFHEDGAWWFRSSRFQDNKDRVVAKQDGDYTYLASDIAYHYDKLQRGFDRLINIWGADHHGYIPRMEGAIQAFGFPKDRLTVVLVQMVSLLRGGKKVEMSKRAGEFVTLQEVQEEVGSDAAKFFFLMRRSDTHLEFDLELAKKQSAENPVYYVQYAHARLASLFRVAEARGISVSSVAKTDLSGLVHPEEIRLMKHLSYFPGMIEAAARALEPHRITFYLQELASLLHVFYYKHRVLPPREGGATEPDGSLAGLDQDDSEPVQEKLTMELTHARLVLLRQVQTVLKNGLDLLGISSPDKM
ncbi:MAG: arginine--tRNA ligase [Nitrospirota bacterium]|nr:arginine--tRNA ligase [Nitrospirota bacterium]